MEKNSGRSGDAGLYGRAGSASTADDTVANRAKAIGVIRKAQEFLSTSNPSDPKRALELAAGRLGLTYDEYKKLVDADPELADLERSLVAPH
jgi:hypothetical protein